MKWMGGWSWQDLCSAPEWLYHDIIQCINDENDAIEAARR